VLCSEGSKFNAGNGDVPGTALIRIMTVVIIVRTRSDKVNNM